eukprot:TRINITY_DN6784_c1_g1_i1.p1 TRINITY_DN6784_c1_g1~~TRINITY_DN6784_c1_g1_i1.p1  ORF type:complete len:876 (+),score=236.17 TRINITY_DN6784_c1_g1_i1:89-2716(+)
MADAKPAAFSTRRSPDKLTDIHRRHDAVSKRSQTARTKRALGRYKKGRKLGAGGFGTVYKGIDQLTGQFVAVKEVGVEQLNRDDEVRHEFDLLQTLRHENIVRYIDFELTCDGKSLRIYLEYVEGGSLAQVLTQFGALGEAVVRTYTRQVLEGLRYLHQNNVMHRDIKPANLLVTSDGSVKLADFGASKRVEASPSSQSPEAGTRFVGTPAYMSPEALSGQCTFSADIWSVGCTLIELLSGVAPWLGHFKFTSVSDFVSKVLESDEPPPIPQSLSQLCHDFLKRCLHRSAGQRATPEQLIEDPFMHAVEEEWADGDEVDCLSAAEESTSDRGVVSPSAPPARKESLSYLLRTTNLDSTVGSVPVPEELLSGSDPVSPPADPDTNPPLSPSPEQQRNRHGSLRKGRGSVRMMSGVPRGVMHCTSGLHALWLRSRAEHSEADERTEGDDDLWDMNGLYVGAHNCNDVVAQSFFETIDERQGDLTPLATPLVGGSPCRVRRGSGSDATLTTGHRVYAETSVRRRVASVVSGFSIGASDRYIPVAGTIDGLVSLDFENVEDVDEEEVPTDTTYKFDVFFDTRTSPSDLFERIGKPLINCLIKNSHGGNKLASLACTGMPYSGKTQTVIGQEDVFQESHMGFLPLLIKELFDKHGQKHRFRIGSLCTRKGQRGVFDHLRQELINCRGGRWEDLAGKVLVPAESWEQALRMLDLSKFAFLGVKSPILFVIEAKKNGAATPCGTLFIFLLFGRQWTFWFNALTHLVHHHFAYATPSSDDVPHTPAASRLTPLAASVGFTRPATPSSVDQGLAAESPMGKYLHNPFLALMRHVYSDENSMNYILFNFHTQVGHAGQITQALSALSNAARRAPAKDLPAPEDGD